MEINDKIRELTDKIRKEGIEKAEAEAARILTEAEREALLIKKNAEMQSAAILDSARREADSYAERVRADLRLSTDQLMLKLRSDICELLLDTVVKNQVEKNMRDHRFVSSILLKVVENWKEGNEEVTLEVLLPGDLQETVEELFRKEAGEHLNNNLVFKSSKDISGGFEIKPVNGHYKLCFTDEAFEAFLKDNFRPVAKKFLFGEEP